VRVGQYVGLVVSIDGVVLAASALRRLCSSKGRLFLAKLGQAPTFLFRCAAVERAQGLVSLLKLRLKSQQSGLHCSKHGDIHGA